MFIKESGDGKNLSQQVAPFYNFVFISRFNPVYIYSRIINNKSVKLTRCAVRQQGHVLND